MSDVTKLAHDEITALTNELMDCRQCFDALSQRAIAITAERDAFLASLEANARKIDTLTAQRDALLAALKAVVKAHPDADSMGALADAAIKLVESAE
jgi:erythromycin esterase-like protein